MSNLNLSTYRIETKIKLLMQLVQHNFTTNQYKKVSMSPIQWSLSHLLKHMESKSKNMQVINLRMPTAENTVLVRSNSLKTKLKCRKAKLSNRKVSQPGRSIQILACLMTLPWSISNSRWTSPSNNKRRRLILNDCSVARKLN